MEKEKATNKASKEMMNHVKELFPSLDNEEVLDEFSHDEYLDDEFDKDETLASSLPPNDDVHASTPPAHEKKEMVIFVDGLLNEPLHTIDEHIDTFIQNGRHRWYFGHLILDRDPIYDIEGTPQENEFELSSS
jgi:hypothetical protein